EGRVAVQFDVVTVEDERLARRTLALLAAVHEHHALLGRGAQDRLGLADLDLDADRFEPDDVLLAHGAPWVLPGCADREWEDPAGPPTRLRRTAPRAGYSPSSLPGRPAGPPRT